MAQPGEFTRRAFRRGKFDLSQAEAASRPGASTCKFHRVAMNQMRGSCTTTEQVARKLLQFVSLIELELDFRKKMLNLPIAGNSIS